MTDEQLEKATVLQRRIVNINKFIRELERFLKEQCKTGYFEYYAGPPLQEWERPEPELTLQVPDSYVQMRIEHLKEEHEKLIQQFKQL